jgi:hypothetical protein
MKRYAGLAGVLVALTACGDDGLTIDDAGEGDAPLGNPDGGVDTDGSTVPDGDTVPDGTVPDGATPDSGTPDSGTPDGGTPDGGTPDASPQSAWRGAEMIENLGGSAGAAVPGMDGAGRAIVVWSSSSQAPGFEDFSRGWIHANHYDPSSGWGTPIALSPEPTPTSYAHSDNVDLAVNAMGEAMAVWVQVDADDNADLIARRFTPAGGWLPATVLLDATSDTTRGVSWYPRVAIGGDGTATVIWSQRADLDMHLYARRFVPSSGWGPATLIQSQGLGDALAGDVAMDGSGNAVAVWSVRSGGGTLWSSRFAATGGWSTPQRLDEEINSDGSAEAGYYPRVAVEPAGTAIVVWEASTSPQSAWARIGAASGAWQPATRLEAAGEAAVGVDIAIDATGDAIAVWHGTESISIRARRYTPGAGWGPAETVESTSDNCSWPRIAMSPDGTATVAWEQNSGSGTGDGDTWTNRFVPGAGWGTPMFIGTPSSGEGERPAVAAAAGGLDSAVAVWPHTPMPIDGHPTPLDVWANVFR